MPTVPMFVLISEYTAPLPDVEAALPEHANWVAAEYGRGRILVSGRRMPPIGGLLVVRAEDEEDALRWIATDPLVQRSLAHYSIVEFGATDFPKLSAAFERFISDVTDLPGVSDSEGAQQAS